MSLGGAMAALLSEAAPLSQAELDQLCTSEESETQSSSSSRKLEQASLGHDNSPVEPTSHALYARKRRRCSRVSDGMLVDTSVARDGFTQAYLDSLMIAEEGPEMRGDSPMTSALRRKRRCRNTASGVMYSTSSENICESMTQFSGQQLELENFAKF